MLSVDAIKGITDLVESMHQTISSVGGLLGEPDKKQTKGYSGLIYSSIRGVTEQLSGGIDVLLEKLSETIDEHENSSSQQREAVIAALNGVLGDHLTSRNNPLAVQMNLRNQGKIWAKQDLATQIQKSSRKILIMVHGSSMNDLQWNRRGHDHGTALARDFQYLPLYIHYNSGLHISSNGENLSDRLEELVANSPTNIELNIIAHSMGGLVSRSAISHGKKKGKAWPDRLRKIVFLGTPHHGTLLERAGNLVDILLQISPYSSPFARLGKIRSSGITDLRYGYVSPQDWENRDRFEWVNDRRIPLPLPSGVECYSVAATTCTRKNKLGDGIVGDGLVSVDSALGRHNDPKHDLAFPKDRQWISRKTNHLDLLGECVYDNIRTWMQT